MTKPKSPRALIVGISAISLSLVAGVILERSCQSQTGSDSTGAREQSTGSSIEPSGGSAGYAGADSFEPGEPGVVPGSSGDSSPGAGSSGSSGYSGPSGSAPGSSPPSAAGGTSSSPVTPAGPDTPVSSDDTTVSFTPTNPPHEWTREEMLLARPMGMSGEEREFDSTHKAPETIRTWTLTEFNDYVKGPLGQQSMLGEGQRWISLAKMLRKQEAFSRAFVAGKKYIESPTPAGSGDDSFLPDKSAFAPDKSAQTFENLKACRNEIAVLCRSMDELSRKAEKQGKLKVMEEAMSGLEY